MKNIPHLGLNPQPAAVKFHALTVSTMCTANTSMSKHFFVLENMHSPRLSQKGNTAFNKNFSQDFLLEHRKQISNNWQQLEVIVGQLQGEN